MSRVKCFWLEPLDSYELVLRMWCHECDWEMADPAGVFKGEPSDKPDGVTFESADWPLECPTCHRKFDFSDEATSEEAGHSCSMSRLRLYTRSDTGEVVSIQKAPPGAMWDAYWMRSSHVGPDGRTLAVKLPGNHDWIVDSVASNCTRRGEPHACWPRRGEPPNVTVDKSFGDTCNAGGGSILAGDYHGFLRNGYLEEV